MLKGGNRMNTKRYTNISGFLMFLAMLAWFGRDGSRTASHLSDIVIAIVGFVFLGICLRARRRRESPGDQAPETNAGVGAGKVRLRRKLVLRTAAIVVVVAGASGAHLYIAPPERAQAIFQEGMLRMGAGDYKGAVERFTKALDTWPRMATGYFERGVALDSMNQKDAAIADFERALSTDSTMASAHTAMGTIYRERGDLTRAMNEFALSLQLKTSTEALYERGQVHESLGQHQPAVEDYSAAIHEQPDAAFVYRARAISLDALGDHAGAAQDRSAFGHRCLDGESSTSCF